MEAELLKESYFQMLRIRLIEEAIADRYSEQQIRCPVHLSIGQEAVAVGACQAICSSDYCVSSHRSHGHYLAKGGNLNAMIAEMYGKVTGCCGGKGGSMHLIDLAAGFLGATPIVGSTIPIGVGVAFGSWMSGAKQVTLVFFGEGATEEGRFHESVNFAMLKKLPVVFVCENNLYSVYSPLSVRQPDGRSVSSLAAGHGMESHAGDGNDVVQVYGYVKAAADKARRGNGPTFLEFSTYRWREHCGPNYDNDIGYRTVQEFESWKEKCPVNNLRRQLLEKFSVSEADMEVMTNKIQAEISEAFAFGIAGKFPDRSELISHLYAVAS